MTGARPLFSCFRFGSEEDMLKQEDIKVIRMVIYIVPVLATCLGLVEHSGSDIAFYL